MLPSGFKKDSRVWLHKNTSSFPRSACNCDGQRIGSDDPYECLPPEQRGVEPIITDASGRIYKKDSRTWLHKSSRKKLRILRGGDILEEVGTRINWRQEVRNRLWQTSRSPCVRNVNPTEGPEGVMRTRSSTELIRAQSGISKIKKKKTMALMSMVMNPPSPVSGVGKGGKTVLDTSWLQQLPAAGTNRSTTGASYQDLRSKGKGNTTVSAFASDLCIAGMDTSPTQAVWEDDAVDSDDSSSNDYGEDTHHNDDTLDCLGIQCDDHRGNIDGGVGAERRSGGIRRMAAGCERSTLKITRDGLRELERMMKQQNQRQVHRLEKPVYDRPGQTPRCDVSPESLSSDSKLSLDANINLSEEIDMLNQSQNSTEQLTQATEYLYVCTPKRKPTS